MTNKKWKSKRFLGLATLMGALNPLVVFAEDKALSELTYPVSYSDGITYLEKFTSKVYLKSEGLFGLSTDMMYLINSLVQAVFWFNKLLFYIFAEIYNQLLSNSSNLTSYITLALNSASTIYSGLTGAGKGGLLLIVGPIMAFYVAYVYFVQNQSFFKALFKVLLVFVCSQALFMKSDGKYVLLHIYQGMNTITQEVATTSITNLSLVDDKEGSDNLSTMTTDGVLNKYFDVAVWTPYVYMNAEVDIQTDDDGNKSLNPSLSNDQLVQLLSYDSGNKKFKMKLSDGEEKSIEKIVYDSDDVQQKLLSDAWGSKFSYAFASLLDTVVLGLILSLFAIVSFANNILVILLLFSSGFVALASMIPTFENILFNFLKRLFGTIAVSSFLSVIAIVVLWVYDLVSLMVNTIFFGSPLLSATAKLGIMWYVWHNRSMLGAIFSTNKASYLGSNLSSQLSQSVSRARSGLHFGAKAGLMAGGGYLLGRAKQQLGHVNQLRRGAGRMTKNAIGSRFKQGLSKHNTYQNMSKRLKNLKDGTKRKGHWLAGNLSRIYGEGVKSPVSMDKHGQKRRLHYRDSPDYQKYKQKAKDHLLASKKNTNISRVAPIVRDQRISDRQRGYNLETKNRLLIKRRGR